MRIVWDVAIQLGVILIGATMLGLQFGWHVGVAVGFLGYGLMPYSPDNR